MAPLGLPRYPVGNDVGCGVDECFAVPDAVDFHETVGEVAASCEPPVPGASVEGHDAGVLPDELCYGGFGRGGTPGNRHRKVLEAKAVGARGVAPWAVVEVVGRHGCRVVGVVWEQVGPWALGRGLRKTKRS